jgi:hypothetical protein
MKKLNIYILRFYRLHPQFKNIELIKNKTWVGFPSEFSNKWLQTFKDYNIKYPQKKSNGNGC